MLVPQIPVGTQGELRSCGLLNFVIRTARRSASLWFR